MHLSIKSGQGRQLWSPSVSRTRQLEIRTNPKYFLPLLCYAVIVDGRRSCRSSGPHTFFFSVH